MISDMAGMSQIGMVRENNQDAFFGAYTEEVGLFLVADGMGGHYRGELASQITVGEMAGWWQQNQEQLKYMPFFDLVSFVEKRILQINSIVYDRYQMCGAMGGCTLCTLLVHHDAYAVYNVGDSRLYVQEGFRFRQITVDDVWENQAQIRALSETADMSRDVRRGRLTKALGNGRMLSVTLQTGTIGRRTVFFLCSDGVYKPLQSQGLCALLRKVKHLGAAVVNDRIAEKILKKGAPDNFSMITVLMNA